MSEVSAYANGDCPQRFYLTPEHEEFADLYVKIRSDSGVVTLPAHSQYLAMNSEVLRGVLDTGGKEFTVDGHVGAALMVLRMIYTGCDNNHATTTFAMGIAPEVLQFADRLRVGFLDDYMNCVERVFDTLGTKYLGASFEIFAKVASICDVARQYKMDRLEAACYGVVSRAHTAYTSFTSVVPYMRSLGPRLLEAVFITSTANRAMDGMVLKKMLDGWADGAIAVCPVHRAADRNGYIDFRYKGQNFYLDIKEDETRGVLKFNLCSATRSVTVKSFCVTVKSVYYDKVTEGRFDQCDDEGSGIGCFADIDDYADRDGLLYFQIMDIKFKFKIRIPGFSTDEESMDEGDEGDGDDDIDDDIDDIDD